MKKRKREREMKKREKKTEMRTGTEQDENGEVGNDIVKAYIIFD